MSKIVANGHNTIRKQALGNSRLDFLVEHTYIEVKTSLAKLPYSSNVSYKSHSEFNSFNIFIKHIYELYSSLNINQRAILLNCFICNNPRFKVPSKTSKSEEIITAVRSAVKNGIEIWQINMEISLLFFTILRRRIFQKIRYHRFHLILFVLIIVVNHTLLIKGNL